MRPARNILLVEDEPTLQRILGSVLTDAGHRVESVGTAEQAIERLSLPGAAEVDLVLSDKNLPGMNGLDLMAQVRATEGRLGRNVGFMLVTGYPSRESALAVLANDGDGYLVKPFRSLSHAVEEIQAVLTADLALRRAAAADAKKLAQLLAGVPTGLEPGLVAAIVVDDPAVSKRVRRLLEETAVAIEDLKRLPPTGRVAVLSTRVENLQAFARARRGAALVLLDGGASFSDMVALIAAGGGAVADPGLLPDAGGA
jgi:CheY-like chemotaxis protein